MHLSRQVPFIALHSRLIKCVHRWKYFTFISFALCTCVVIVEIDDLIFKNFSLSPSPSPPVYTWYCFEFDLYTHRSPLCERICFTFAVFFAISLRKTFVSLVCLLNCRQWCCSPLYTHCVCVSSVSFYFFLSFSSLFFFSSFSDRVCNIFLSPWYFIS